MPTPAEAPLAAADTTAHVVRALVLYALAEHQAGHATTLQVSAEGRAFSVADDGRGHAPDRAVGGAPDLSFTHTQLDYPFAEGEVEGVGTGVQQGLKGQALHPQPPDATHR
jgi:hypothetical protein